MGLFYKKATNKGAIIGVVLSIPIALYFKVGPNGWADGSSLESLFIVLPFMKQMMITCLLTIGLIALVSYLDNKGKDDSKGIALSRQLFETSQGFNISSLVLIVILVFLYVVFW